MRIHIFMPILFLSVLMSCGEDVGQNRKLARKLQGAEPGGDLVINSQIHRSRGLEVISYALEAEYIIANTLPSGYRTIPDMLLDDEGTHSKNVITVEGRGRPTVSCGLGDQFSGVDARINDCVTKNGDKATWSGENYGAAGEGTWSLVALSTDGKEIWRDSRTNQVWSDTTDMGTANWCQASGNKQVSTTGSTTDCKTQGSGEQLCQELAVSGLGTNVHWRLPTRNDFLQADLDGARFVLKASDTKKFWTATLEAASEGRTRAWVYDFSNGTLSADNLLSLNLVRCIGSPVN